MTALVNGLVLATLAVGGASAFGLAAWGASAIAKRLSNRHIVNRRIAGLAKERSGYWRRVKFITFEPGGVQ